MPADEILPRRAFSVRAEREHKRARRRNVHVQIGAGKGGWAIEPSRSRLRADDKRTRIEAIMRPARRANVAASLQLTERLLATLPNLPAPDVPDGLDETANVVVHTRGTPPAFDFAPKEHDALALRFGYDPDAAAAIAGRALRRPDRAAGAAPPRARAVHARCQRRRRVDRGRAAAAGQARAMFGTGQLPKFADDAFQTTDGALPDPDRRGVADQPDPRARCSTATRCRCASPR